MSDKPPKACPGCNHPFHLAGNCRALEAGRCPCERNMAIVLDTPPIIRHETYTYVRASELDALRAENERLKTEREHLIEAASQIQSRLTVCQTHEAGWRERAENAEGLAWKHGNRADEAEAEIERLRAALRRITDQGKVCAEFELCTHVACQSSYEAWSVADAALKGETPESANDRALREFGNDKRA